MLGLTLHLSGGGGMQRLIYSLFIVISKLQCIVKKTFIIAYLILTNKFLLKTNQNEQIFCLLFLHRRDLVLFPNRRKYIGIDISISPNELKHIGISDISKNTISLIPNI